MNESYTTKELVIGYGSIVVGIALAVYVLKEVFKSKNK